MTNKQEKQQWSSKWMFIFAAVSSAVGLGNIWRFPFAAFENGGGAFIIPFLVAIFVIGVPLMLVEFSYGSKLRGATPLAFARVSKKFEFVGWIPTIIAALIVFYYGVILVWSMNFTVFAATKAWGSDSSDFFINQFLRVSDSAFNLESINWAVMIGLVVLWVPSYIVLARGVKKGLEKVNKIILPLMFTFAILLVIRGVTLDNAFDGLNAFFTPDFGALFDANVWLAAFGQAMFSLSLCMGIMVTYSSYMKKGTEIVNTSYLIAFIDVLFSLLFSVGIFAILGYMASVQGIEIGEVSTGGMGLVFVTLPVALNYMGSFGFVVGIGFFGMLTITGWTSFLSLMEAGAAPFVEKFGMSRKKIYLIFCIVGFTVSAIYATGAGQIILGLVDHTVNTYGLPLVGLLQVVVVAWIAKKLPEFQAHINHNHMPYFKAGKLWLFSVKWVIPIFLTVMLGRALLSFLPFSIPFIGDPPGILTARTAPELVVFVGGTVLLILATCIILPRVKWRTPIENYEDEEELS